MWMGNKVLKEINSQWFFTLQEGYFTFPGGRTSWHVSCGSGPGGTDETLSSRNAPCVPQFPPKGYNILVYDEETRKINTLVNAKHLDPATKNAQKNGQKFRGKTGHVCTRVFFTLRQKKKIKFWGDTALACVCKATASLRSSSVFVSSCQGQTCRVLGWFNSRVGHFRPAKPRRFLFLKLHSVWTSILTRKYSHAKERVGWILKSSHCLLFAKQRVQQC